jgi:Na+-driven multidrug efflux pump
MWIGFSFNLMWATVFLILSYYFIQNGYGVTGLALANLIAYFAHSLWQTSYVFKVVLAKK